MKHDHSLSSGWTLCSVRSPPSSRGRAGRARGWAAKTMASLGLFGWVAPATPHPNTLVGIGGVGGQRKVQYFGEKPMIRFPSRTIFGPQLRVGAQFLVHIQGSARNSWSTPQSE